MCLYWCEKARKYVCVTDRHDMTLAVQVPLNPDTTNQPTNQPILSCIDIQHNPEFWKSWKIWTILFFPHCFQLNMLNPFLNKLWFLRVCSTSLLKTLWEKKKLLVTSNFSFSHCVFYPFEELSCIFIKFRIVVCKLFQLGRV